MKTTGKCILSFVAGLGIGGMVGYKVYEIRLNKVLEEIYNEEGTEETAEEDAEVNPEPKEAPVEDAITEPYPEKPDLAEYSAKILEARYSTIEAPPVKKGKASPKKENLYPIDYEEFGENEYDCVYYTVYNDDIIANENGDKITTFKKLLGKKLYDEVMTSEYDSMFIRDERRKVDYQIVKDPRSYYSIFQDSDETALE